MEYEFLGLPFKVKDSIRSDPCYFGDISRQTATEYLTERATREGTYLIRETNGEYRLSKLELGDSGEWEVMHYKIERNSSGNYFIDSSQTFPTILSLVDYYKGKFTDMEQHLTDPCPRYVIKHSNDCDTDEATENDSVMQHYNCKAVKLNALLSHGPICDVWTGKLNATGETVVIKTVNKDDEQYKNYLFKEASSIIRLQHDKIVKFFGQCVYDDVFLVYEFSSGYNLLDYLVKGETLIDIVEKSRYAKEITDALIYVTSMGYVHRNIRASNVLLSGGSRKCKLSGFGHAEKVDNQGKYAETKDDKPYFSSDIRWMAPEAFQTRIFTAKSDVWSFACTLFEIFSNGTTPFSDFFHSMVLAKILDGYRPNRPIDMCYSLYYLLLKCWDLQSDSRPNFNDIQCLLQELFMPSASSSRKNSVISLQSEDRKLSIDNNTPKKIAYKKKKEKKGKK